MNSHSLQSSYSIILFRLTAKSIQGIQVMASLYESICTTTSFIWISYRSIWKSSY